MQYWELLEASARRAGANPEYLGALLAVEGSGERAVSPAGALGLMQLMPDKFRPGDDPFNALTNLDRAAEHVASLERSYPTGAQVAASYFGAIDPGGNVTAASDGIVNGPEYVRRFEAALACVRSGLGVPGQAVADLVSPIGLPITAANISFNFLDDYGPETAAYIRGAHGVQQLGTRHLAWDLVIPGAPANGRGYPVLAPLAGRITRTSDPAGGPLGVWLDNPALNLRVRLMHMDTLAPEAVDGAQFRAGQWLGTLGGQGTPEYPHLHVSLELLSTGERLDPARFFFRTGTRPLVSVLSGHQSSDVVASARPLTDDRAIALGLPGLEPVGAPAVWGGTLVTATDGPGGHGLAGYDLDLGWAFLVGSPAARGQRSPTIHANQVVWLDSRNVEPASDPAGRLVDVYSYDIQNGLERRLTGSPGQLSDLVIDDDRVAWVRSTESERFIEQLDLSSGQLFTAPGSRGAPSELTLSGRWLAWIDRSGRSSEAPGSLKAYDLEAKQPLTLQQIGASSPAFVGSRLYWLQQAGAGGQSLIRGRDVLLSQEFTLGAAAAERSRLKSAAGTLSWLERSVDGRTEVLSYGPSSEEMLRLDDGSESGILDLAIGPGSVVWRREDGQLGVAYQLDWDLPDGHVFAERLTEQPWAGRLGFRITNEGGIPFWNEYRRLGGLAVLGRPIGERAALADGFVYQLTERALLQWRPELGRAVLANSLELLQQQGFDSTLEREFAIPLPVADDGSAGDPNRAQANRLGWLTDAALRSAFYANPDPDRFADWTDDDAIQRFGLPMSKPERRGDQIVQRFQRAVLQRDLADEVGLPRGNVVRALRGGEVLRTLLPGLAGPAGGLLPD